MKITRKKDGFEFQKLFVLSDFIYNDNIKNQLVNDLFVTDIGYFPKAKHHYRERSEGSDSHIFIYCSEGEGWVKLDGNDSLSINKHTLIVIPAGIPHQYGSVDDNPWSIYWFHLRGNQVINLLNSFGFNKDYVHFPVNFHMKFTDLFNQCYDMLTDKPYSQLCHIQVSQTMRYLLSTLGIAILRSEKDQKREHYLDSAIQFMTDHLDTTIKLSELAIYLGLSQQHIIYIFKQETGFPPIDYFIRMKMHRACQMLDLTDMLIKEICGSLGMSDQYYFSRSFKKIIGCSPTEYRKIPKG